MLDKYLQVVCDRTKLAAVQTDNAALLGKLPVDELYKLACGLGSDGGTGWLEQFKGTPLLQQAIAIEKEDLALQMERNDRRRQEDAMRAQFSSFEEEQAKRDQLAIKRKLLELELAGGGTGEPAAEAPMGEAPMEGPPVEEAPVDLEAAPPEPKKPPTEKVTTKTTEKPTPEKIDVKQAAARLRGALQKTAGALTPQTGLRRGVQLLTGSRARALEGQAARHAGEVATARAGANEAMHSAVFGLPGQGANLAGEQAASRAQQHLRGLIPMAESTRAAATGERQAVGQARRTAATAALAGGGGLMAGSAGHDALGQKTAGTIQTISAHTIPTIAHTAPAGVETAARIARNSIPAAAPAAAAAAAPAARAAMPMSHKIIAGTGAAGLGIGALAGGHRHPQGKTAMLLDARVKEAFFGAIGAGLKGMGQFAQTAGKGILAAGKAGGMGAASAAAANAGRSGLMRAGQFIAQNPGAGAAMVAAPALAAGYAAGRQ